jgi:hypothetical protein
MASQLRTISHDDVDPTPETLAVDVYCCAYCGGPHDGAQRCEEQDWCGACDPEEQRPPLEL